MRLFLAQCADEDRHAGGEDHAMRAENMRGMEVVCDEEAAASDSRDDYAAYLTRDLADGGPPEIVAEPRLGHMERLEPAAMRTTIVAELVTSIAPRTAVTASCTVSNRGDIALATADPYPVYLSYRWFDEAGALAEIGRSVHTALAAALEPGASAALTMRIEAPRFAGRYALRVALLQSNVAWFDDVDRANGVEAVVDVGEKVLNSTA